MGIQENRDLLKSSYTLLEGNIIGTLLTVIGSIIIIRLISVEEYSLITMSYIIPSIMILLGELGLNAKMARRTWFGDIVL